MHEYIASLNIPRSLMAWRARRPPVSSASLLKSPSFPLETLNVSQTGEGNDSVREVSSANCESSPEVAVGTNKDRFCGGDAKELETGPGDECPREGGYLGYGEELGSRNASSVAGLENIGSERGSVLLKKRMGECGKEWTFSAGRDRADRGIIVSNIQKRRRICREDKASSTMGKNPCPPSLMKLCIHKLSQGVGMELIEKLPAEIAEEILMLAIPRAPSTTSLSRYLHSGLCKIDFCKLPRCLSLTDILVAASINCQAVESLALPSHTSDELLQYLPSRLGGSPFPNLQDLAVGAGSTISDVGIDSLTRGLARGLRSLCLSGCSLVTDSALIGVLQHGAKSMQELRLADCKRITDDLLEHLPAGLVRLDLAAVWRLTDAAVEKICRRSPDLEELDISGVASSGGQLTVFGAVRLTGLRRLSVLILKHQRNIGNLALSRIRSASPGMRLEV